MDWWLQAAIITGMFMLRLGVPLAITLLVGYFLHRLDAKWQAEAEAQWKAYQMQAEPVQSKFLQRLNQPCWIVKGCDAATRAKCSAAQQTHLPCWLIRRSPEGRLLETCYECDIFLYGQSDRRLAVSQSRN